MKTKTPEEIADEYFDNIPLKTKKVYKRPRTRNVYKKPRTKKKSNNIKNNNSIVQSITCTCCESKTHTHRHADVRITNGLGNDIV